MGIAGISIWPLYYFGATPGYSIRAHMFVQTDCFLFAFIVGFLWTAVPRFTGTTAPSRPVQYCVAGLVLAAAVAFEAYQYSIGQLLFLLAHSIFITVTARRFLQRKSPPPESFALVGSGILAGLIGACVNAALAWGWIAPKWDLVGTRMLTEGMGLLLILGVGGFLGPRLLGFAQLPNFQPIGQLASQTRPPFLVGKSSKLYALAGMSIIGSIVFEYGYGLPILAWLRAAVGTAAVFIALRPWRFPIVRTTLAWCVWTAHWFLILGLWTVAAVPVYRAHFLHILFMGAFTLMILAVGTRVVLSHGGHALTEERKSWPLRIGLVTGACAMLVRIGAPFAPRSYFGHLTGAALLWIGGMVFWGIYLLRRIRS
jgi:uncharacterized protein involved in response to NO